MLISCSPPLSISLRLRRALLRSSRLILALTTLTDRSETNFFTGDPLRALSTLSYSENVDLQRSAALAFAEITEKVRVVITLNLRTDD